MDEKHVPWDRLYKADLKGGYAYPVRNADVATALEQAGVAVASLSFFVNRVNGRSEPKRPPGRLLLIAEWNEQRELPFAGNGGGLTVYAASTLDRKETHDLLVGEALPIAARWLAEAAQQGQAWREMRHERWITLAQGGLNVEDREGGHWSTTRAR
jgi:hypothetical protein